MPGNMYQFKRNKNFNNRKSFDKFERPVNQHRLKSTTDYYNVETFGAKSARDFHRAK